MKKLVMLVCVILLATGLVACDDPSVDQAVNDGIEFVNNVSSGSADTTLMTVYNSAKQAIRENIVSPSSAVFPPYDESFITECSDGSYTVSSYLDADNTFGARIRSNYTVSIILGDGGFQYRIISMD